MRLVIGLTGEKGAGKSMAAGYLMQMYQASIVCARDVFLEIAQALHLPPTNDNIRRIVHGIQKGLHAEVVDQAMITRAAAGGTLVVLDSIRTWKGQHIVESLPGYRLVAITAPPEIRFRRADARNSMPIDDPLSFDAYAAGEQGRTECDIPALVAAAAVRCDNSGTVDELRKRLYEMMKEFGCTPFPRYSRR